MQAEVVRRGTLAIPLGFSSLRWHGVARHGTRPVTSDHEPAHVHITGVGQAKVNLLGPGGTPKIIFSAGIKRADMRRLLAEVIERRDEFLRHWERIHGTRD